MAKVDITVIVPTKNETKNLACCLEPIYEWAAKVIVVDSNSTDNTAEIAESYNAEVILFNYQGGWPKKRQYVLDNYHFSTAWILLLDSDEILTPVSKRAIENAIAKSDMDGYYLSFNMEFLGRMLRRADPGLRKLSLFRTGKGKYEKRLDAQNSSMGDMEVHEHVIVDGKVGELTEPILHRNLNDLSRFIIKHDEYSNYESRVHTSGAATEIKARFMGTKEERRRFLKKVLIRNPLAPVAFFFYLYLLKGGFLEGRPGFYYVLYQCMYLYFVSSKIYEIETAKKAKKLKILFIAPLPPPVTGQSLASKVFFDELSKHHDVEAINFSKTGFEHGINSWARIGQIFMIIKEIWFKKRKADIIYLTISESLAGNIKDLLIYLICFRDLRKMVIHLHGGSIRKLVFDRHKLLFKVNKFFLRRLGSVIVLGQSHVDIFSGAIPEDRIKIVSNCAEDYMFADEAGIKAKFANPAPLKIIFLSNLISGKGHNELVDAFMMLDENAKKRIAIDFAGSFESEPQKAEFLEKIRGHEQIRYHGIVHGAEKQNILAGAHVFCLPTGLLEGQPISILEAYASGCVVVTTNQGGIRDIFKDKINGFEIQKDSAESVKNAIKQILEKQDALLPIAISNRQTAYSKYRMSIYNASLIKVVENVANNTGN